MVHGFVRCCFQAAKSTNAWLITGGCNIGYMRAVGDAINQGQYLHTVGCSLITAENVSEKTN